MSTNEEAQLRASVAQLEEQLAASKLAHEKGLEAAQASADRMTRLEALLDVIPVGVVLADNAGKIILGNDHVEKMVRHPVLHSDDVDSYGEWIAFHEDGQQVQSSEYPLSKVIRDGERHAELDVHYQRGDETRFWLRIIGQPIFGDDGKRIGAAVALVDIDAERRLASQQKILIAELNHRVKNAFSVVKAIVSQSLRKDGVQDGLRGTIDARLNAYAGAHSKLIGSEWDRAPLGAIADDILPSLGDGRIHISGTQVELSSRHALALSMAFYELGTNSVKYGALSVPEGHVEVSWALARDENSSDTLTINWLERGGPEPVEPEQMGFGSFIIKRALEMETGGDVTLSYSAQGFEWQLSMRVKEENQD